MTSAAGMPCPVCRVPLTMSERQGVEIDYCPQCRGVWLDRGELDKIWVSEPAASSGPQSSVHPALWAGASTGTLQAEEIVL
jgi:Zn-finger nucleic acid-binding protein